MLVFRHIDTRPDEPRKAAASRRGTDATHLTNGSVGSHNPFREVKAGGTLRHFLDFMAHGLAIVVMHERQVLRDVGRLAAWLEAMDPKQFRRPVFEASDAKCPASRVGKPLSLR